MVMLPLLNDTAKGSPLMSETSFATGLLPNAKGVEMAGTPGNVARVTSANSCVPALKVVEVGRTRMTPNLPLATEFVFHTKVALVTEAPEEADTPTKASTVGSKSMLKPSAFSSPSDENRTGRVTEAPAVAFVDRKRQGDDHKLWELEWMSSP